MPEKKEIKKKKKHPLRTFFSLAAIFVAAFLVWLAAEDFITTLSLKKDISDSEAMITDLENQQAKLTDQKTKMEDPAYVKRYARGKYMVSKPGEQVFKLPSKDAAASDSNDD